MPKAKLKDDEAVKMISNVDVQKHALRIIKLRSEINDLRSDIKSEYDQFSNAGGDRKALKLAIKEKEKPVPDEERVLCNRYLKQLGQLPLFAGIGSE